MGARVTPAMVAAVTRSARVQGARGLWLATERVLYLAAIDTGMYATDRAIELAVAGVPFRDAYRQAADIASDATLRSPEQSLAARVSPGSASALRLDTLLARLASLRAG